MKRMKKIFILLFIFLLITCKKNKYEKVINDFSIHSFFICLKVEYNKSTVPIVLENSKLYSVLSYFEKIDRKKYITEINRVLKTNTNYNLQNYDAFSYLRKYEVSFKKEWISFFDSREKLICFFNRDGVLMKKKNYEEKKMIIYMLFKYDIFVKIDDETGYLYIESE